MGEHELNEQSIDFHLTEEMVMLRQAARQFAQPAF